MALIRRTAAATLAALTLTGAIAAPAQAYWHTGGTGSGTVRTAGGVAKVITLNLTAQGNRFQAAGKAGTSSAFGTAPFTVTVVICKTATWPCPSASVVTTLALTATAGAYSGMTPTGVSYKGVKAYGMASQTQSTGWTDYSAPDGPTTP
ncbi:hypothetical protein ACQP2F_41770 [Actinoplanes sp. CA-030573]|uniref:hypothetical protein n=1 Tax=Actinoplanes sp. CA-030573 TaxID=3239898 RepID=UPI003D91DED5